MIKLLGKQVVLIEERRLVDPALIDTNSWDEKSHACLCQTFPIPPLSLHSQNPSNAVPLEEIQHLLCRKGWQRQC